MKRSVSVALGLMASLYLAHSQGHVLITNYVSPYTNQVYWTCGGVAVTNTDVEIQVCYREGVGWSPDSLYPGSVTTIDPTKTYDPGLGHGGGGWMYPALQALPDWQSGDTYTFCLKVTVPGLPYRYSQTWQETSTIGSIAWPPEYAAHTRGVGIGPLGWPHPPLVSSPPSDKTVAVGDRVWFEVSASAYFNLQWFFNDAPIAGAVTEELVLNNVQTDDAGVYSVSLYGCGTVTCSATLTVVVRPILVAATLPYPDYIQEHGFPLKIMVQTPGVYAVEASTNLVHWTAITNLLLEAGETEFLDRSAVTQRTRFYRAAVP